MHVAEAVDATNLLMSSDDKFVKALQLFPRIMIVANGWVWT